ncbi:Ig-like domain-containing protein [Longimicrobium sp.]|jgi:hypothetical protein|uniref:Ig-like domain-containing protein n=1 Tax=Longimicrobium sp. TaxID=2029185 RepID=UPI002ED86EFB
MSDPRAAVPRRRRTLMRYFVACALLPAALLAACDSGGTTDSGDQGIPASVALSAAERTMAVGDTLRLTATVRNGAGSVISAPVSWASSAPDRVSVTAQGHLTALAAGTATITATAGTAAGNAVITVSVPVNPNIPDAVVVSPTQRTLAIGDTAHLTATVRNASGQVINVPVTWSTSAADRATVNAQGIVTAVAAGSANIVATAGGKSAAVAVTVSAAPPPPPPPGQTLLLFTRLPFDPAHVGGITPLGTLGGGTRANPEIGHPFGNERHFVWHRNPGVNYTVYAPVTARIVAFRQSTSDDFRVDFLLYQGPDGKQVTSYLDHITALDPAFRAALESRVTGGIRVTSATVPVNPALEVTAGTVLGTTGQTPVNWDWGIVDERTNAVARPESFYSDITRNARPVYDYATPQVQAQLQALSGQWNAGSQTFTPRVGAPPMGEFTNDVPGTLSGIWFHDPTSEPYPHAVSINPYSLDTSRLQMLLQVPGLDLFGRYTDIPVAGTGTANRRPTEVTAASGIVSYVLVNGVENGVLYARVNADGTITLEAVRGAAAPNAAFQFTAGAVTLRR